MSMIRRREPRVHLYRATALCEKVPVGLGYTRSPSLLCLKFK
jgi:hypothetical protein